MKVKKLIPAEAAQILSEESVRVIEEAFTNKLNLTVESALAQQDDLYAKKLNQLMVAIDKDHTFKLKRIVEAIDKNQSKKLKRLINKYESSLNTEAASFKKSVVGNISNYLEEALDEAIPRKAIREATKNRTARVVLNNLRNVLGVDSAFMKESIQEAVVDGKQQIDALAQQVKALQRDNALLKEGYTKTKAALVLESKISGLPDKKKEYLKRVLSDKTAKFIEENFDYTLRLFDKKERERLEVLKEQAFTQRTVKADAPILRESSQVNPHTPGKAATNPYVSELERYK